jgi:hypothetical protein
MATYPLPVQHNRRTNELHPLVYRAMIGLTIWLVLSVWALFSRGAYEGVTLSIITLFFVVLVGIPVILWLTWRRNTDLNDNVAPYREWSAGSFETWTGGISGPGSFDANLAAHRRSRLRDDDLWSGISVCNLGS